MPVNSLFIFFLIALFFAAMLQIHIFEVAFVKLGLTPEVASFLLLATLLGSGINLPIYSMHTKASGHLVMSQDQNRSGKSFSRPKKVKWLLPSMSVVA